MKILAGVTMKKLRTLSPKERILVVACAFAVVGVIVLTYSLAATSTASLEPEVGTLSGGATAPTIVGASGSKGIKFSATATPVSSGTWPTGWDDPRFAGNVTGSPQFNSSGNMVVWQNLTINDGSGQASFGYGNYSLLNTRIRSREGPRISGSNILIEDTYIEVAGVNDDHGDGIQAYHSTSGANTNFKNVVVRRTKIVLTGGALNAGIFLADRSGVDLTLEDVYVDGGPAPNGALFFANSADGTDRGCNSLTLRHVRVKPSVRFEGLDTCNIIEWTDVAYENGTPIPSPH